MGHKVNPISFRLQVDKNWQSRWFAKKGYAEMLHEDLKIRRYLEEQLGRKAGIAKVEVERNANQLGVTIHTSRPGVIIGRGGSGVVDLKNKLGKMTKGKIKEVNIQEIKNAEACSKLVAENIAQQLEKRIPFKRAIRQAIDRAGKTGVKGIKIMVSGRLNGAEIARNEHAIAGKIPLATLDALIDYGTARAKTTYGILGIKVWIYNGMKEKESKPKVKEVV